MIRTLLVANRGEIARRVFRTCRDLGIATVAVHADADVHAPFVTEADVAVRLPGDAPADTYLRGDLIVEAALAAGADAVHPGYGFLAESPEFARAVEDAGLVWIGPRPASIEAMGSKAHAKQLMAAAGVPVLAADPESLPVLIKASAGGGGRGMRVVTSPERLAGELRAAQAEALSAVGDGTVFLEPYLPAARHVEVQVLVDTHGTIWILGDRDCSIQRRHQKLVEEAPAPHLSETVRAGLHAAARAAVEAVDYRGAGTVEFLVDGEQYYFLEMNTRLQVEHPVTECVTGLDLVALQLAIAEGQPLPGEPPEPRGHAIEVRLYAEDPAADFAPRTGRLRAFEIPGGPGIRVDSAVECGSEVGVHYDAMLAKVIAFGPDRATAIRLLDDTLRRTAIHGVTTNIALLRAVLADEEFRAGRGHTGLLGERIAEWSRGPDERTRAKAALAAAIGSAVQSAAAAPVLNRLPAAWRNAPSQPRVRTYRHGDREYAVTYERVGRSLVSEFVPGVDVVDASFHEVVLRDRGVRSTYRVTLADGHTDVCGPDGAFSFEVVPTFVDPAALVAAGALLAPMPGTVTTVAVEVGAEVRRGDVIVVLEAMKMLHSVAAPVDGVLTSLGAGAGQQVAAGTVLAVIEEKA